MGVSNRQTPLGHRLRHRVRMAKRSPRAIDEPFNLGLVIALHPLVSGLSADFEASAHRRKGLLALHNRDHKAHPLIHGTGLHPSHRQGPPCRSVDLLPMSSVYSVTHLAGLDPPLAPPHKGEGNRPSLRLSQQPHLLTASPDRPWRTPRGSARR